MNHHCKSQAGRYLKRTREEEVMGLEQNGGSNLQVCSSSASEQYLPGLQYCTSTRAPRTPQSFKHWDSPGTGIVTQGESRWKIWQPQCARVDLANAGETYLTVSQLSSSLYCICKHNQLLPRKGKYKPTAGTRTWTFGGKTTVLTTRGSLFRTHPLYLLCLCQSPLRVQRER